MVLDVGNRCMFTSKGPSSYYKQFSFIDDDPDRRANTAMVAFMDEIVGNITSELKTKGMWERTFLV